VVRGGIAEFQASAVSGKGQSHCKVQAPHRALKHLQQAQSPEG
jgi:hypothetical protein